MKRNLVFLLLFVVVVMFLLLGIRIRKGISSSISASVSSTDTKIGVSHSNPSTFATFIKENSISLPKNKVEVQFVSEKQKGFQTKPTIDSDYSISSDWATTDNGLLLKLNINVDVCRTMDKGQFKSLIFQHIIYQSLSYKQAQESSSKMKSLVPQSVYATALQKFPDLEKFVVVKFL